MGDARKSISDFLIPRGVNQRNVSQQQKRQRTSDQLEIPHINISAESSSDEMASASTETIIHQTPQVQLADRSAIHHDRLLDKIDRYTSHDQFLRKCIVNKIIPMSYKITVEPSIGNHDDEFLKGYYELLEGFSNTLMQYTADYCTKKREEFEGQQRTSEEGLKSTTNAETFAELQKTFDVNRKKRQKALQEIKDKKFFRLKYRTQHQQTREQFYGNNRDDNQRTTRHPGTHPGGPQRNTSRTNMSGRQNNQQRHDTGLDERIESLEKQLNEVRRMSYSQVVQNTGHSPRDHGREHRRNGNVIDNRFIPNRHNNNTNESNQRKNDDPGQPARAGTSKQLETTEVLDYISTAMRTLGEFERRLKQQPNNMTTPSETS